MTAQGHDKQVDGRRLRRVRSKQAAIDAMIDLVLEDHVVPSVGRVAERAGVSQASLFRYFATVDDLRREAIGRYFARFDDLIAIPDIGEGDLADRIERFVTSRDAFYERTAPMARLARRQAASVDDFAETLERVRATFTDQVAQNFAPEFGPTDSAATEQRIAVIAALTSFEAWEQLGQLSAAGRRDALACAISDLLT